jgi:Zn-dependent protease with chaperone function
VTIAACLLLYSLAVAGLGPPLLRRLNRGGHAPRFGVAAWLTAVGSVLTSWMAAAVFLVTDVTGHWNEPHSLIASCLTLLGDVVTGDAGMAAQVLLLAVSAFAAVATAAMVARVARTVARMRACSHDHAQSVRLVGRATDADDVVVVDAAKPAAYCVSGRPPAIVVTTAALAALDDGQLRAVLAHERAHLAGHHAQVVAALRGLAAALPNLTLITDGAKQVSWLLEMCADDAAARRHGQSALLSGLVVLSGAVPAGALAAADVGVIARAERLTTPQTHLAKVRARAALSSAMTMMAAGPLITAALAASGALICSM